MISSRKKIKQSTKIESNWGGGASLLREVAHEVWRAEWATQPRNCGMEGEVLS